MNKKKKKILFIKSGTHLMQTHGTAWAQHTRYTHTNTFVSPSFFFPFLWHSSTKKTHWNRFFFVLFRFLQVKRRTKSSSCCATWKKKHAGTHWKKNSLFTQIAHTQTITDTNNLELMTFFFLLFGCWLKVVSLLSFLKKWFKKNCDQVGMRGSVRYLRQSNGE